MGKIETDQQSRRIAVIAVHGVGHHAPNEASRATADMLARVALESQTGVHYTPFIESAMRVPVEAVSMSSVPVGEVKSGSLFDERPYMFREQQADSTKRTVPTDVLLMCEQLQQYQPQDKDVV